MEWWVWLLLIAAAVLILIALYWTWTRPRTTQAEPPQRAVPEQWHHALPAPAVPEADDLAEIEGIGPRIHDVLHEAGITTFAQLAEIDVDRLREILVAAEVKFPPSPETWPMQARLAADSRWQELKELQNSLKGGSERG
jgi:predicted flap endonuclease-1-like 5' DNA nuclease